MYSSWEEDKASLKLELGVLEQYNDYPAISPPAVMWCSIPDQHFTPAAAYTYYSNEAANIGVCYQAAVLLVDVPPWGDRKCEVDNTGAARLDISMAGYRQTRRTCHHLAKSEFKVTSVPVKTGTVCMGRGR